MSKLILKYKDNIQLKKIYLWSLISFFITLPYIFILFFYNFFGIRDMWSFHISFHLLNYKDFGFVKRGVVGSFFKPIYLLLQSDFFTLETVILVTYIVLLSIFCLLFWHLCFQSRTPKLVRLSLLIMPATFQFLGFNSPRTSELIWLILFAIWCLIFVRIKSYQYIHSLLSGIIISLALLTYEGALFIIFPTIFLNIINRILTNKKTLKKNYAFILVNTFIFISPVFLTTYILFSEGNFAGGSIIIQDFLYKVRPGIPDSLSEVLVNDHISENAKLISNSKVNWFSNNNIFIIYFFSYFLANLKEYLKDKKTFDFLISLSSFSGIFLCAVAVDYSRYIALSIIVSSMTLFVYKKDKEWVNSKLWMPLIISGILGPIGCAGMVNPFPLWKYIFDFVK